MDFLIFQKELLNKKYLFLKFSILLTFVLMVYFYISKSPDHQLSKRLIQTNRHRIILWTKWFNLDWRLYHYQHCLDYQNCIFTYDRSDYERADAILFHWLDINPTDMPKRKRPNQKWILFNLEPPVYTWPMDQPHIFTQIDWIMSYRTDSDIYLPYGRIKKCRNSWKPNYKFENKVKQIAWFVSRCESSGQREDLVKQLNQYMSVDVFGKCGHLKCKSSESDDICNRIAEQNYKFYLSFENCLCKDYVTEKLFRTLKYDIIPVVFGSANYSSILPHNSYIDVFNFTSVEELSRYLIKVMNDKSLYESYFHWKNEYCIEKIEDNYFCEVCQRLNEGDPHKMDRTKFKNLVKWWLRDANCSSYNLTKIGICSNQLIR